MSCNLYDAEDNDSRGKDTTEADDMDCEIVAQTSWIDVVLEARLKPEC